MKTEKTNFKDLLIFKSKNFFDKRGFFRELSVEKNIKKRLVFTVVSKSKKNVLRGFHMQTKINKVNICQLLKVKSMMLL